MTLRTMVASLESILLAFISSIEISGCHPYRPARRPRKKKSTMALARRRNLQQEARRPTSQMEERVRVLRRLVPNGESMELHGLLREATDYISDLQARIKGMEMMVKVLSDGSGKWSSSEIKPSSGHKNMSQWLTWSWHGWIAIWICFECIPWPCVRNILYLHFHVWCYLQLVIYILVAILLMLSLFGDLYSSFPSTYHNWTRKAI